MLLPSRACLLSVRETLCVARRAGLLDAGRIALEVIRKERDRDRAQSQHWRACGRRRLAGSSLPMSRRHGSIHRSQPTTAGGSR